MPVFAISFLFFFVVHIFFQRVVSRILSSFCRQLHPPTNFNCHTAAGVPVPTYSSCHHTPTVNAYFMIELRISLFYIFKFILQHTNYAENNAFIETVRTRRFHWKTTRQTPGDHVTLFLSHPNPSPIFRDSQDSSVSFTCTYSILFRKHAIIRLSAHGSLWCSPH